MAKILFFADLKRIAAADEVYLSLSAPVNQAQFWDILQYKYSELARWRSCTRMAKNGEYAAHDTIFEDGDEIALIPPVSGG